MPSLVWSKLLDQLANLGHKVRLELYITDSKVLQQLLCEWLNIALVDQGINKVQSAPIQETHSTLSHVGSAVDHLAQPSNPNYNLESLQSYRENSITDSDCTNFQANLLLQSSFQCQAVMGQLLIPDP